MTRSTRRFSVSSETPSSRRDRDLVEVAALVGDPLRLGRVTWAMLAPPKEALPSWVKPTRR